MGAAMKKRDLIIGGVTLFGNALVIVVTLLIEGNVTG
jgi:hypothetical protein